MSTSATDEQYPDSPTISTTTTDDQPLDSSPPTSTKDYQVGTNTFVKDVMLWRKKKVSATTLAAATATWVLLQIYQFNVLTVISWVSMAVVILLFLWGNLKRLLNKPPPSMPTLEVSDEATFETAQKVRRVMEEGVRWMFKVGAESEWYEFAKVVGGLLVISWIGTLCDLLTFLYIGVLVGLSAPVIYVKYEERIKGWWEQMRVQGQRWLRTFDEKVVMKMKHKAAGASKQKEKKIE